MLKLAIVVALAFGGVSTLIILRSPKLTVRRWIAAISILLIAASIIGFSVGKGLPGTVCLIAGLGGLFSLRFVDMGVVKP